MGKKRKKKGKGKMEKHKEDLRRGVSNTGVPKIKQKKGQSRQNMDGRSRCMRALRWIVCSLFEGFLEVLSGMLTGMLTTGTTMLNGYPGDPGTRPEVLMIVGGRSCMRS